MAKKRSRKSRPRWRLRVFLFLLLVAVGVWFLPWLASRGPLRATLIASALPQFEGEVQVESMSAGWFSPLELQGVRITDADGEPLLEANSVRTQKTLAGLLGDSAHLGTFHIERPSVHVAVRLGGSNVEDALAPFLEPSEDPSLAIPQFEVRVTGGTIFLEDLSGAKSELREVAITVAHDATAEQPLTWNSDGIWGSPDAGTAVAGTVVVGGAAVPDSSPVALDEAPPAKVTLAGFLNPETLDSETTLKTHSLNLAALQPLLSRFRGSGTARGDLTADVRFRYDAAETLPRIMLVGVVEGRRVFLQSDNLLAGDALHLEQASLDVDCAVEGDELVVNRHVFTSDIGQLQAEGRFGMARLLDGDLTGLLNDEAYAASGNLDLARLANMLPGLLHVREGTQFTEGELTVSLSGAMVAEGRRWEGRVETSNLKGLAAGRPVSWREPVVASWQAIQDRDGKLQGSASCTADFLELTAEGTPVDASLNGTCDLNRLREALSQFLDLGGLNLAGTLAAEFRLRQPEAASQPESGPQAVAEAGADVTTVHADGRLRFEDFVFQVAEEQVWREPRMEIAFDATGRASATGVERIDQALLHLTTPGDQLRASLVEPVSPVSAAGTWPLDLEIRGALETWYPRLQRLALSLPVEVQRIAGKIRGRVRSRVTAESVALELVDLELTQVDFLGGGYSVQEPRVVLVGDARWDRLSGAWQSRTSTLQTSALSLRLDNAQLATAENGGLSAAGKIALAADLARLQRWFHDPAEPVQRQWAGALTAGAELSHEGGVTTAEWEANMNDLVVSQPTSTQLLPVRGTRGAGSNPWQKVWSEREVFLSGRGRHLSREGLFELSRLEVSSDTLKLAETRGKVGMAEGPLQLDLSGNVIYDLEKITALLQPYLGSEIQLVGTGTRPFAVQGRIGSNDSSRSAGGSLAAMRDLTGQAGVGWSRALLYGLPVGEGELKADLRDNVIHIAPLDMSVGEGRFRAQPRIDLAGEEPLLIVEPAKVVESVRLSPELCRSWLKYVAPLLAEATRADGTLSVDLTKCQVPLSDMNRADVAGTVSIQSAQVRPGPVAEQLIFVAQQVEAIVKKRPLASLTARNQPVLNVPAQELQFEVREGRVHHKDLQLAVGDVVVRTTGSVGLDSTLEMVAEIPIQSQWVAGDRHLQSLAGQVIKVPLRGTLGQPKLDRRALDDLTKQMVGSAAGGLIDDALNRGINKGLEELFGR